MIINKSDSKQIKFTYGPQKNISMDIIFLNFKNILILPSGKLNFIKF